MSAPYPQYKGDEPCTELGIGLYYNNEYYSTEREAMDNACFRCPVYDECLEWAVQSERWGYWAATTQADRTRIRKMRGILEIDYPEWRVMPRMVTPMAGDERDSAA